MDFSIVAPLLALILFAAMFVMLEVGRRIGNRQLKDSESTPSGVGAIEGAIFALLGLLIAFTFSGASERFDSRRKLVVEEANSIGTAYLRIDMLPADAQPRMRELFRLYLDSRLETYRKLPDFNAARAELTKSADLQNQIWKLAVIAGRETGSASSHMLVLPALNQMIDITTTRTMAFQFHPPVIVFILLISLSLISAMLAGYGMANNDKRRWFHIVGFAAVMTITVYTIIDIEYPRLGFIRIDSIDQVLRDLRQSMN